MFDIQYFRKDLQEWETRFIMEGTDAQAIQYMQTEVAPRSRFQWRVVPSGPGPKHWWYDQSGEYCEDQVKATGSYYPEDWEQ